MLDDLLVIGEAFSPTKKVWRFAGYSGWSARQLESEIKRKAWCGPEPERGCAESQPQQGSQFNSLPITRQAC